MLKNKLNESVEDYNNKKQNQLAIGSWKCRFCIARFLTEASHPHKYFS